MARQAVPAPPSGQEASFGCGSHLLVRGRPMSARAEIRRWQPRPNAAGTVLGYLDVGLPSGMVVNGCRLMIGPHGKPWIAMPSERQVDKDGKPRLGEDGKQLWTAIVDFVSREARDRFTTLILEALRRQYPEAFSEGAQRRSSPPQRRRASTGRRFYSPPKTAGGGPPLPNDNVVDLWR